MPARDLSALLTFASPYRAALAAGTMLMLLESAAALAVPWFGSRLAEMILANVVPKFWGVTAVLTSLLALFAFQAILKFGSTLLLGGTVARIDADLRTRIYDHLQSLPLSFFQQRRHGDTLALLTRDVYLVSEYLGGTLIAIGPLLITVAGALFLMLQIQPALALLAAFLVPVFYLVLKILGRGIRPLSVALETAYGDAIAHADQNLGMLPAIKAFTREAQESDIHARHSERILSLTARQLRIQAAMGPAIQFTAAAGLLLVLWLASGQIEDGKLTPPQLVGFLLYAQLLTRPVAGLADVYGQTLMVRAAASLIVKALDEQPEPAGHIGATLPPIRGDIDFQGVSFAYAGCLPALQRIDLHIAAGETVAIIGHNGAGKSTLAQLLMRLHEPNEGRITIDGTDIATVSLFSLRRQIGVVPQHVLLFNASVRHNIAYSRPEALDAEIKAAARAAQAHDFIVALPQGYDTMVGDRGVRLSGGQQQRLALARALLKNPPILILDEATAMFDPEGEREFLKGYQEILESKTVLLITHSPASLAVVDRTIRLEGGRVCLPA